jgi:beta-glucosidase
VSNPADYPYPFWDPCQPLEDRITNLLSLLTPSEKLTLLTPSQPAVSRLGLPPESLGTEGLHGLAASDPSSTTGGKLVSTQFPQAFGLGESWDPEVTRTVGATTGHEARVYNARGVAATGRGTGVVVWAPNVDLVHDPRWGRTEESYGEDPYLIGELAKTFIAGLHGEDPTYLQVGNMLKHFAANSNETTRLVSSSDVDDRNLHEYYTASFRTAVRDGHANGMMTSYNEINGVPAAVTPLLQSLVRGEWGFDGFFSTDGQSATIMVSNQKYFPSLEQSVGAIVKGGTGLLLQTNGLATLTSSFGMGLFTEADMDVALRPVFRARFRLGDFDPPASVPYKSIQGTETPWLDPVSQQKVLDVTRKTIVLLKNADRALPLDPTSLHSVAVIGPRADSVVRDWYGGAPPSVVTPRQGIADRLGAGVTINYAADDTGGAATAAAASSDVALVFVGNHPTCGDPPPSWGTCPSQYEGREQVDRVHIALEPAQETLVESVLAANPRTFVVEVSSFPQGIGWIDDHVPAIVHVTNSSQALGTAIADVLFGDYNPAGRTTTTWYRSEDDIPTAITDYDIKQGTTYWYFTGTPLYPFGYGLSYARFAYANPTLSAQSLAAAPPAGSCGLVEVGVDVTNTSAVAGDEVVQLYVAYPGSDLQRPLQQLRGFRRVNIAAGATAHVTFDIGAADLGYWDAAQNQFAVETGKSVELQIGASSRDIRLRGRLAVTP